MKTALKSLLVPLLSAVFGQAAAEPRANVVLMMADDQGWGETGYNGHPKVKTPVLDEMAASALRLDRFYSGAPNCTPTRASVMTGRHANRSGAFAPNWSTRPEEITLARLLKNAGYRTGHFGKWHLGAVKAESPVNPGRLGFDEYVSHDNFFEMNPVLSRNGAPPEAHEGESSEIIVDEAVRFMKGCRAKDEPFFIVVWFGSPHGPYSGKNEDVAAYAELGMPIAARFAEITAMDRAIGVFRSALRAEGVAENTLLWFNSDNGIPGDKLPDGQQAHYYNGGWRGAKGSVFEGGLRVPAIVEWPAVIRTPRRSDVPCVTSDILPTVIDLLGLHHPAPERPLDGISLAALIRDGSMSERPSPIGFWKYPAQGEAKNGRWINEELSRGTTPTVRNPGIDFLNFKHPQALEPPYAGEAAWTVNQYKLIVQSGAPGKGKKKAAKPAAPVQLYDLLADPKETTDIAAEHPDVVARLKAELETWQRSVEHSLTGADYR